MLQTDDLKITPLGAGSEVGRSCIHISYKSFELLLDCGIHPAYTGIGSLPFLDLIDLSKIDAIFITHFHLDHAGALPYLTEKTNFKGQVFMTHPTKAILRWLLNDYIRIINANSDLDFYTEEDLNNCYEKIISIDYHQSVNLKNLKITALNAGHVLGAAMFLIENDIFKLLYTGDYSTEEDRHLKGADITWLEKYENQTDHILDVLICESTYGVQCHLPRDEREKRFTSIISDIVLRGGKCLLPVFALGRAQELLLILEDYWERNQKLQKIPIYYASALATRCLSVYQAYAHMMKINISKDAFSFKHIKNLKNMEDHLIKNACVVMASPGMLQNGLSRELFEMWCEDPKNGTVIAGYSVQGTLAKEILNEPKEIISLAGNKLKLNMKVDYVSFSAHVDFVQNSTFIEKCRPKTVMLVHGEANEMGRLKTAIENNYQVETMKNGEMHSVQVRRESVAVGRDLKNGQFSGIAVSDTTGISLYKEEELKMELIQKIRLPNLMDKIETTLIKGNGSIDKSNMTDKMEITHTKEGGSIDKSNMTDKMEITHTKEEGSIDKPDLSKNMNNSIEICQNETHSSESTTVEPQKNAPLEEDPTGNKSTQEIADKISDAQSNQENIEKTVELDKEMSQKPSISHDDLKLTNKDSVSPADTKDKKTEEALHKKTDEALQKKTDEALHKETDEALHKETDEALHKETDEALHKKTDEALQKKTDEALKTTNEKEDLNQVKVQNTFNATPVLIKQLLLNQFPSIELEGNTLFIENVQVIFENDIFLLYKSSYLNDMLACTIIRLIENITTRENVKLCKISKKSAIVKVLNNFYDVLETNESVEIKKGEKMVILNEREIKGDPELLEDVKKVIKRVVNII
ncbi:putative beta-lactamase fold-containing exonuclease [Pseudoloma neurophilia]|uniref:Endoribonuclease YSH1 n=1 Tax=Pseudoloma neurophilia TaxID=146866 RepID=A0A0R0M2P5_9MICR|nr:putative beta-lactamase fold-containing exonuclease [Pseudoloma neurophilia]